LFKVVAVVEDKREEDAGTRGESSCPGPEFQWLILHCEAIV